MQYIPVIADIRFLPGAALLWVAYVIRVNYVWPLKVRRHSQTGSTKCCAMRTCSSWDMRIARQTDRHTYIHFYRHNSQPSQRQTSYKILSWNDIHDEKITISTPNCTRLAYNTLLMHAVCFLILCQSYQMKSLSMVINSFVFQYNFSLLNINSKNNILS